RGPAARWIPELTPVFRDGSGHPSRGSSPPGAMDPGIHRGVGSCWVRWIRASIAGSGPAGCDGFGYPSQKTRTPATHSPMECHESIRASTDLSQDLHLATKIRIISFHDFGGLVGFTDVSGS